ncbi:MAG TPA: mechanosensitive ion channel domain-containing protein [Dinghuibacter sp.]|uniref:mechanosensitive ion channel family protein n=1 Tax=Dinghuibacter sp. TaxID=2024697 RepID=UPI002C1AF5E8|nr:mechanosensitive ion channel domain-containing protein [Dinghuibacter sp.]HTJ12134.1 mechanosensitive ion channel domain-containing protein [Dinghuibacter sp.]
MHPKRLLKLFLVLTLLIGGAASAQHKSGIPLSQRILEQISQNDSTLQVSAASDTVVPYLINKRERLSEQIGKIGRFYRHGLDTQDISAGLPRIERGLGIVKQFVTDRDRRMNIRSLNNTLVLVEESVETLKGWQQTLQDYSSEMSDITESVQRIVYDSTVRTLPSDTALYRLAVLELRDIDAKYRSVDTLERGGLIRLGLLQSRVEAAYLSGTNLVDEINYRMKRVKRQLWDQEEATLWQARRSQYAGNLWQDITESLTRGMRVVSIYMASTWDTRSVTLVALVLLTVWCWINLRRIRKRPDPQQSLAPVHFLTNNVFIGCLVLVVTFGAFLESNIPMSYLHLTGLIHVFCISWLLYPYLTRDGRQMGLWMLILWLGYSLDDSLGETTYGERWLLLAGAVATILLCLRLLARRRELVKGIGFPNVLRPLVSLMLLMAVLSLYFDITGRITLSKLMGLTGTHSFVYAITLWVASTVVLEMVYLQSEASKDTRFSAFLNFAELQQRFQYFLRLLSGLFWFSILFRNLSVFEPVYNFATVLITKERTLGSITFSFGSVFVFLLIIWVSSILAQFITFLFGQNPDAPSRGGRRRNIGAIALMARLGILTIGFLIAVGAAGIPLEKISFIIGALGVGIGFGMQTIVNNLVSGIILTFERPIQVGDQIDVAGKSGVVKEIGIRASKISNFEGADIIIPNGDLLSQTLTNWTLHNRNRRTAMTIRTDREADLNKVTDLIRRVLSLHKDIMTNPGPSVQITNFGGNWVEYQIQFWVEDLGNAGGLTHSLITELNEAFDRAGVNLANPGQDIYIRSTPGESQSTPAGSQSTPGENKSPAGEAKL